MAKQMVLVIDDDDTIVSTLESLLEQNGYIFLGARNGKRGLEVANDKVPNAIILDLTMPEMEGHEVLKHLKENNATRNIPCRTISPWNSRLSDVTVCELTPQRVFDTFRFRQK